MMAARRRHRIGNAFGAIYALRDEAFDELGLPPLYDGAGLDKGQAAYNVILEDGGNLLLEDGGLILLEQ